MSKNRRFSEKERERERERQSQRTTTKAEEEEEEEEEATSAGEPTVFSLSRSHFFRRARPSAKELLRMLLVFIFVIS